MLAPAKDLLRIIHALWLVLFVSTVAAAQSANRGEIGGGKGCVGRRNRSRRHQPAGCRQFVIAAAQTDEQGRFRLAGIANGSYELRASYRGFAPLRVAVALPSAEAGELELTLGLQALAEEVTVTADIGLVQGIDQTSQRVNVIDESQLQERAQSVLAQVSQEEAGINLQRTSPTIGAIFVRGLTGAKVVTFIDGVRFSTAAMRGGINSFFNLNDPSNLRAVEILRGPNKRAVRKRFAGRAVQLISQVPSFSLDAPSFADASARSSTAPIWLTEATLR